MIGLGQPIFEVLMLALVFAVGYSFSGRSRLLLWLAIGTLLVAALLLSAA
jgi:hypothetical protein